MDLSAILAELKSIDDFQQPDARLASVSFCQRAIKTLDKLAAVSDDDQFENQVISIWIVFGSFIDVLPRLADCPELNHFVNKLFRECARVVLNIKWAQLQEEEAQCQQNLQTSVSTCHYLMLARGVMRFATLQALMESPWTDSGLVLVMSSEEDNEDGEGLAYIQSQDPEILKLRVELMQQQDCDEFALNLSTWCLKHPALAGDLAVRSTQMLLLHRLGNIDRLQEECQSMNVADSVRLINNLLEKEEQRELCVMLAQTFLVQHWIKLSDDDANKELLRLWIRLQYQADQSTDRFISSLWAIAKLSRSTEQLLFIIDAVREQCGDQFLQFYTDLCVFAINVEKGCWEKLKTSASAAQPTEEMQARKKDMAQICNKLGQIVSHVSPKISFCCALTAFAMVPSEQSLQAMLESHQRKVQAGLGTKKCCSNCASDQGQCLKEKDTDQECRDVNIATLYEVERLTSNLRPEYLSCDSDISTLYTMCKQYLRKEKGELVQSALVRRPSQGTVPPAPNVGGHQTALSAQAVRPLHAAVPKPNILRGSVPVSATVGIKSEAVGSVSNLPGQPVRFPTVLAAGGQQQKMPAVQSASGIPPKPQEKPISAATLSSLPLAGPQVLEQLSFDTVQTLLHLIQSGQISVSQLSEIGSLITKTPNVSVQVMQNLVNRAKQPAPSTAQQQLQQQQQLIAQQRQQIVAQQQKALLQQQQQQQVISVSQAGPSGSHVVLQSTNFKQQPSSSSQQQSSHQVIQSASQQLAKNLLPRSQSAATAQIRPQHQQQQVVQGLQQIRPSSLPQGMLQGALQNLRVPLGAVGEIQVTQPVHIMTFRTAPATVQSTGGTQPVLIQTTLSQMLTQMSGGVMSVSQQPSQSQVLRFPSSASIAQKLVSGSIGGQNQASASVASNRHYNINNLLFTGEQQNNSALSITLPDTLPEISVDAISDTLRALSDPSSTSSSPTPSVQGLPRMQQAQQQFVTQAFSFAPQTSVSAAQKQSQPKKTKKATQGQQSLPSFSSLFHTPLSLPSSTAGAGGSEPLPKKGAAGQARGSKKAAAGEKKGKQSLLENKEEMKRLLQQALTIDTKKDGGSVTSAHIHSVQRVAAEGYISTATPVTSVMARPQYQQPSQSGLLTPSSVSVSHQQTGQSLSMEIGARKPNIPTSQTLPSSFSVTHTQPQTSLSQQRFAPFMSSSQDSSRLLGMLMSDDDSVPSTVGDTAVTTNTAFTPLPTSGQFTNFTSAGYSTSMAGYVPTASYATSASSFDMQQVESYLNSASGAQLKTYSRSDLTELEQQEQEQQLIQLGLAGSVPGSVTSVPIPASILPEGGLIETSGREGENSIATYRCIICAKAFMTLDALRVHVKKICRPGLAEQGAPRPAAVENGAALNKPPPEAGTETSTVFQCMRCFELCISEQGIREHKQVCSKAPKAKSKPKSRAKPKPPKSEEETATEAKVQEILNKCLGENREKLQEEIRVQEAKREASRKRAEMKKKRGGSGSSSPASSDRGRINTPTPTPTPPINTPTPPLAGLYSPASALQYMTTISSAGMNPSASFLAQTNTAGFPSYTASSGYPASSGSAGFVPRPTNAGFQAHQANPGFPAAINTYDFAEEQQSMSPPPPPSYQTVVPQSSAQYTTQTYSGVSTPTASLQATAGTYQMPAVPAPPPAQQTLEHVAANKVIAQTVQLPVTQPPASSELPATEKPKPKRKYYPKKKKPTENSGEGSSAQAAGASGTSESTSQAEASAKTSKRKKSAEDGSKAKKAKKEPKPPTPKYKELVSSGGQSFFKCLNCGQTLCSMENFMDHWKECIVKKHVQPKPRRLSKEKKGHLIFSSQESIDEIIATVASENYIPDETAFDRLLSSEDSLADLPVGAHSREKSVEGGEISQLSTSTETKGLDNHRKSTSDAAVKKQQTVAQASLKDASGEVGNVQPESEKETVGSKAVAGEKEDHKKCEDTSETDVTPTSSSVSLEDASSSDKTASAKKAAAVKAAKRNNRIKLCSKRRGKRGQRKENVQSEDDGPMSILNGDCKFCTLCKRQFSRRVFLIQHLACKHVRPYTLKKLGNGTSSCFCHLCQKAFAQFSGFMVHASRTHTQAILKKALELQAMKSQGSPGHSRRIAKKKGASAGNRKKFGRTSPKDLTKTDAEQKEEDAEEGVKEARKTRRSSSAGAAFSPVTTPKAEEEESNAKRTSARAAQKQALSKIFISSLGIGNSNKENNKRRPSTEERKDEDQERPRTRRRTVSKAEEVNEEENGEKANDEDNGEESAGNAAPQSEKASMDSASTSAKSLAGLGKSKSLTVHTSSSPHPESSPKQPSPFSATPKRPTFTDAFLSFISNRSPEAPLLAAPKRKSALSTPPYLVKLLEKEEGEKASPSRHSSGDASSAPKTKSSSTQPSTSSSKPDNADDNSQSLSGSEGEDNGSRSDGDLANVFYLGHFDQQLAKPCKVVLGAPCKVVLGDRIHSDDRKRSNSVEKMDDALKFCTVALGPKIDPVVLAKQDSSGGDVTMTLSGDAEEKDDMNQTGENNIVAVVSTVATSAISTYTAGSLSGIVTSSDSDGVTVISTAGGVAIISSAVSVSNIGESCGVASSNHPLTQTFAYATSSNNATTTTAVNVSASSFTDSVSAFNDGATPTDILGNDNEVCVEATVSVLSLPEVILSSEGDRSRRTSTSSTSPIQEVATVSNIPLLADPCVSHLTSTPAVMRGDGGLVRLASEGGGVQDQSVGHSQSVVEETPTETVTESAPTTILCEPEREHSATKQDGLEAQATDNTTSAFTDFKAEDSHLTQNERSDVTLLESELDLQGKSVSESSSVAPDSSVTEHTAVFERNSERSAAFTTFQEAVDEHSLSIEKNKESTDQQQVFETDRETTLNRDIEQTAASESEQLWKQDLTEKMSAKDTVSDTSDKTESERTLSESEQRVDLQPTGERSGGVELTEKADYPLQAEIENAEVTSANNPSASSSQDPALESSQTQFSETQTVTTTVSSSLTLQDIMDQTIEKMITASMTPASNSMAQVAQSVLQELGQQTTSSSRGLVSYSAVAADVPRSTGGKEEEALFSRVFLGERQSSQEKQGIHVSSTTSSQAAHHNEAEMSEVSVIPSESEPPHSVQSLSELETAQPQEKSSSAQQDSFPAEEWNLQQDLAPSAKEELDDADETQPQQELAGSTQTLPPATVAIMTAEFASESTVSEPASTTVTTLHESSSLLPSQETKVSSPVEERKFEQSREVVTTEFGTTEASSSSLPVGLGPVSRETFSTESLTDPVKRQEQTYDVASEKEAELTGRSATNLEHTQRKTLSEICTTTPEFTSRVDMSEIPTTETETTTKAETNTEFRVIGEVTGEALSLVQLESQTASEPLLEQTVTAESKDTEPLVHNSIVSDNRDEPTDLRVEPSKSAESLVARKVESASDRMMREWDDEPESMSMMDFLRKSAFFVPQGSPLIQSTDCEIAAEISPKKSSASPLSLPVVEPAAATASVSTTPMKKIGPTDIPTEIDPIEISTEKSDPTEKSTEKSHPTEITAEMVDPTQIPTDKSNPTEMSDPTEISTEKSDPTEISTEKSDPTELSVQKIDPTELSTEKLDPTEVASERIAPTEFPTEKSDPTDEISTENVDPTEMSTEKIDPTEIPSEIDPTEIVHPTEISTEKSDPTLLSRTSLENVDAENTVAEEVSGGITLSDIPVNSAAQVPLSAVEQISYSDEKQTGASEECSETPASTQLLAEYEDTVSAVQTFPVTSTPIDPLEDYQKGSEPTETKAVDLPEEPEDPIAGPSENTPTLGDIYSANTENSAVVSSEPIVDSQNCIEVSESKTEYFSKEVEVSEAVDTFEATAANKDKTERNEGKADAERSIIDDTVDFSSAAGDAEDEWDTSHDRVNTISLSEDNLGTSSFEHQSDNDLDNDTYDAGVEQSNDEDCDAFHTAEQAEEFEPQKQVREVSAERQTEEEIEVTPPTPQFSDLKGGESRDPPADVQTLRDLTSSGAEDETLRTSIEQPATKTAEFEEREHCSGVESSATDKDITKQTQVVAENEGEVKEIPPGIEEEEDGLDGTLSSDDEVSFNMKSFEQQEEAEDVQQEEAENVQPAVEEERETPEVEPTPEESSQSDDDPATLSKTKDAEPEKSSDETEQEELPELCIVPDPVKVILPPRTSRKKQAEKPALETSSEAESPTLIVESVKMAVPSTSSSGEEGGDPDMVVSTVVGKHAIEIRHWRHTKFPPTYCKVLEKTEELPEPKAKPTARTYTRVVEKSGTPQDPKPKASSSSASPSSPPPRKPLLGVKSLRGVVRTGPFVWDVDSEDQDEKKKVKSERIRTFRQKNQVAPFSWDSSDEGERAKAEATEQPLMSESIKREPEDAETVTEVCTEPESQEDTKESCSSLDNKESDNSSSSCALPKPATDVDTKMTKGSSDDSVGSSLSESMPVKDEQSPRLSTRRRRLSKDRGSFEKDVEKKNEVGSVKPTAAGKEPAKKVETAAVVRSTPTPASASKISATAAKRTPSPAPKTLSSTPKAKPPGKTPGTPVAKTQTTLKTPSTVKIPSEKTPATVKTPSEKTKTPSEKTPSTVKTPITVKTPSEKTPSTAKTPSAKTPSTAKTPSEKTPTLKTPSEKAPTTVKTASEKTPSTVKTLSEKTPSETIPATVKTPSEKTHTTVKTPSEKTPSTVKTPSEQTPSTVKTPSEKTPAQTSKPITDPTPTPTSTSTPTPPSVAPAAEQGRLSIRSTRGLRRSGSTDKVAPQSPSRSSRNRLDVLAREKPFRKARSCDLETVAPSSGSENIAQQKQTRSRESTLSREMSSSRESSQSPSRKEQAESKKASKDGAENQPSTDSVKVATSKPAASKPAKVSTRSAEKPPPPKATSVERLSRKRTVSGSLSSKLTESGESAPKNQKEETNVDSTTPSSQSDANQSPVKSKKEVDPAIPAKLKKDSDPQKDKNSSSKSKELEVEPEKVVPTKSKKELDDSKDKTNSAKTKKESESKQDSETDKDSTAVPKPVTNPSTFATTPEANVSKIGTRSRLGTPLRKTAKAAAQIRPKKQMSPSRTRARASIDKSKTRLSPSRARNPVAKPSQSAVRGRPGRPPGSKKKIGAVKSASHTDSTQSLKETVRSVRRSRSSSTIKRTAENVNEGAPDSKQFSPLATPSATTTAAKKVKESSPAVTPAASSSTATSASGTRQQRSKEPKAATPSIKSNRVLSPLSSLRRKLDMEAQSELDTERWETSPRVSSEQQQKNNKNSSQKNADNTTLIGGTPQQSSLVSPTTTQYLGAMVKRRQQPISWRTTSSTPAKKPRRSLQQAVPQYELIRVEPVKEDSNPDHRRTRSSDRDSEPSSRTVHTRVTEPLPVTVHKHVTPYEYKASPQSTSESRKWSMSRHLAPGDIRKKKIPSYFPFSFQRAAPAKKQTK